MAKEKIAFIGSGMIGAGMAANAALKGHPAFLYDVTSVAIIEESLKAVLDAMVEAGACTQEKADAAAMQCTCTTNLPEAVTGAAFVQESSPERLELKKSIYRQIQEITGAEAVIGSSTSSQMPSDLQEGALYPERILNGHPFNPAYLLPTIEVVPGKQTSQETIAFAKHIYESMGKLPVIAKKETKGFIIESIVSGIVDLAVPKILDGVATVEDIDKALMFGPGLRLPIAGQILTLSLGIQGGIGQAQRKYFGIEPTPDYILLGEQVDQEIANRPAALGNTVESVIKYRDKTMVEILKLQNYTFGAE